MRIGFHPPISLAPARTCGRIRGMKRRFIFARTEERRDLFVFFIASGVALFCYAMSVLT